MLYNIAQTLSNPASAARSSTKITYLSTLSHSLDSLSQVKHLLRTQLHSAQLNSTQLNLTQLNLTQLNSIYSTSLILT